MADVHQFDRLFTNSIEDFVGITHDEFDKHTGHFGAVPAMRLLAKLRR